MKNLQKGQLVRITDKDFAERITFMETMFGSGNTPDLQGRLTAVDPTPKEFALLDDNFKGVVEAGIATTEDLKGSVVYYDESAGRNFVLVKDQVEVVEEDDTDGGQTPVQVGDTVQATGLGAFFAGLIGGSGQGKVIHVGGQPIVSELVQQGYDDGTIQEVRIQEGVIYIDDQANMDMWLADDDFEVVGE